MDIYYSLFVALLAVLFFLILFYGVRRKSYSFKTLKVENDRNIEAKLRILMR
ncbi:MAG: hypothetical protein IKR46_03065 [Clostridia bacterium]|nr:hypothetical protein [Clostridia bacterium]